MEIKRTFVRDEAYIVLRDWIVKGQLKPGQKLLDKDLAEQLKVSRTPIREALLKLESEGLVMTKPNSATFVAPIDSQHAMRLYSIVWTLEKLALEQAFEHLVQKDIILMGEANEKMLLALKNKDPQGAIDADDQFHSIYITAAKNLELQQMLLGIKQKIARLKIYYFHQAADPHDSYKEHLEVLNALKKKDLPLALNAVEANWKKCLRIKE